VLGQSHRNQAIEPRLRRLAGLLRLVVSRPRVSHGSV
jgi:hypothetical protein